MAGYSLNKALSQPDASSLVLNAVILELPPTI
jgi:hypothetical protein